MEGLPASVRDALNRGDVEAHKNISAKGGRKASIANDKARDIEKLKEEDRKKDFGKHLAQQEQLYHISDEGDVLPPDPEIEDTFKH